MKKAPLVYWERSGKNKTHIRKEALTMKHKMKMKQNQRITRITEKTLVVGVDIAKRLHVARAVDFRGIELGKDCVFTNDAKGLGSLVTWMKELKQSHSKTEIIFGIEPTGHYWFPLAAYLQNEGIKLVLVNPHHVNKSKELEDNAQVKSDYKDAKVIANLVRNGNYTEPKIPTKEYADLRILMNTREKITNSLTQVKSRIANWFDRYFPEYTKVFKSWDGKASLMTMRQFPTPDEIISKGARDILACWKKEVKRGVGIKRAEQLCAAAESSIGLKEGVIAARVQLRMLHEEYDLYMKQEEQIIRLAGLNLVENSSGNRKGKTGISKRGRSRLRALLFRCILPLVAKNKEFKALHKHYTTRVLNPLKKKQSLIALIGRLIRILHTLGTKQKAYNAAELLRHVHQTSMHQSAA